MQILLFAVAIHLIGVTISGCTGNSINQEPVSVNSDSTIKHSNLAPVPLSIQDSLPLINVSGHLNPDTLLMFAETLIGTPYKYASTDPSVGFDCSGFITYVFNHFKIQVPRSSKDFEFAGKDIPLNQSRKGDLILFTGTDSTIRIIGHMGIILSNQAGIVKFIHSSSGKANGVVITELNKYYMGRYIKVIRVFTEN